MGCCSYTSLPRDGCELCSAQFQGWAERSLHSSADHMLPGGQNSGLAVKHTNDSFGAIVMSDF